MADKLDVAVDRVSEHMDAILSLFRPGAKITVTVRHPGSNEQDFMLTSDDPREAIKLIQRRIGDPNANDH